MSGSVEQPRSVSTVRILERQHRNPGGYDDLFQKRCEATRPRIAIRHRLANLISVQNHGGAYAGANTSELAFFRDDEWVVEPIPEFADYHDGSPMNADLAIYGWVPNDLVLQFLKKFGTSGEGPVSLVRRLR
jgi:hypothetical protein